MEDIAQWRTQILDTLDHIALLANLNQGLGPFVTRIQDPRRTYRQPFAGEPDASHMLNPQKLVPDLTQLCRLQEERIPAGYHNVRHR
ncbi:hypothetical protein N7449_008549 [Penicillium cf. viridicatum]|uniref:Uncharacterized protein n=1 Tax=Penicillium cf. viridicatum TaxID=2972119 RepID=A0A9W9JA08_9EURO|nr:hypothetical protein N7449_008549 [Penicillium cf. viridicatum]